MSKCREIEIQKEIESLLLESDISPFSVTFTYLSGNGSLLAMTFYLPQDLDEILDLIDYQYESDKSDFIVLRDTNTLILVGIGLSKFLDKL